MAEFKREGTGIKPRLSFILELDHVLDRAAEVMERGVFVKNYERNNWKNGGSNASLDVLLDSVMRHLKARINGEVHDPDPRMRTDHLANALVDLAFAVYHHCEKPLPIVADGRFDEPVVITVDPAFPCPCPRCNPGDSDVVDSRCNTCKHEEKPT